MVSVGFVGLGNMGGPMAKHLLDAGNELTVFDLDPDARTALADEGAAVGTDPADVAARSEVIFLSLPTPDIVRAVVLADDGVAAGIEEGSVLVDTTTSTPGTTEGIAEELRAKDVSVLGAPVSGGASGAKAGTLTTMVGGDQTTYEACAELFSAYASDRYYVGNSPGDGHVVKLLNNYLSFLGLVGTSEAVALGEKAGLDPKTMVDIFSQSSGRNAATEEKFPNEVITGDYDVGFALALMHKDIRLFSRFADESDAPVLLGDTVRNLIGYARSELDEDADSTEMYRFVQRRVDPSE